MAEDQWWLKDRRERKKLHLSLEKVANSNQHCCDVHVSFSSSHNQLFSSLFLFNFSSFFFLFSIISSLFSFFLQTIFNLYPSLSPSGEKDALIVSETQNGILIIAGTFEKLVEQLACEEKPGLCHIIMILLKHYYYLFIF